MIVNQIISKENLKEDLIIFGQFDNDASGDNGLEYLVEEAKDAGFKNNLEYWASLAEKELHGTGDLELAINKFADNLCKSWSGACYYYEYSVTTDISYDGFLLTVVFVLN